MIDQELANESFCYLTTIGRVTGEPHEIEIWFAARDATIYMLSGGRKRADWVKNMQITPEVKVRLGREHYGGQARIVTDPEEEAWARTALFEKYSSGYGGDLTNWSQRSLLVAIDLSD